MLVCDVTVICPIHLCHLRQDLHCSPVRTCVCVCVCLGPVMFDLQAPWSMGGGWSAGWPKFWWHIPECCFQTYSLPAAWVLKRDCASGNQADMKEADTRPHAQGF